LLGARNACRTEQMSFEIGFERSVGVDRSKMRREGVPNRGASMPKTTTGESSLGTRLGEKGTNNSTGNGLGSFRIKIRVNVAKGTDVKVGRKAEVGNVTIKIEMIVKSDAEELDVVC